MIMADRFTTPYLAHSRRFVPRVAAATTTTRLRGLPRRADSNAVNLLALCLLLVGLRAGPLLPGVQGTITVMETGKHYISHPEEYGKHLWRGYEYMARLQYLDSNPYLCPDAVPPLRVYNITVPMDGVPVALLTQSGGGCSIREKARFVEEQIRPAGVVRYLIVGTGKNSRQLLVGNETEENSHGNDPQQHLQKGDAEGEWKTLAEDPILTFPRHHRSADEEDNEIPWGDAPNSNDFQTHDVDIPFYFLRVSLHSASDLLVNVIRRQSSQTQQEGGPRITLDSRNGDFDAASALWVAISALLSACACSFLLLANGQRNGWWEPPEMEQHGPPRRPERRRLTREQVKRLLPRYIYDKATNRLLPDYQYNRHHHSCGAAAGEHDDDDHADTHVPTDPITLPVPLETECCSICLDEYENGDKVRYLPCTHVFHSKCISKWLSERSATCPLCKTDLYVDDDEEEQPSETNANNSTSRNPQQQGPRQQQPGQGATTIVEAASPRVPDVTSSEPTTESLLSRWGNWNSRNIPVVAPTVDGVIPSTSPPADTTTTRGWSLLQRLFVRRASSNHDMLTEPLLQQSPSSPQFDHDAGDIEAVVQDISSRHNSSDGLEESYNNQYSQQSSAVMIVSSSVPPGGET